jgi:hypothetical protein
MAFAGVLYVQSRSILATGSDRQLFVADSSVAPFPLPSPLLFLLNYAVGTLAFGRLLCELETCVSVGHW